jgi:signal transduction histidine kinase/ActR/RegA family two-component response regulator
MPTATSPFRGAATPLRRRLFILGCAGIVPLAIMAAISIDALRAPQHEQARVVGRELARSVANAVEAELNTVVAVLETLATTPTLDLGDLAGFRHRAERVMATRPDWSAIVLSTPDGAPLIDTRVAAGATPLPVLDRASFEQVVRTRAPAIGNLTREPDGDWFFPVRVPVGRDGGISFVLSAIVTPDAVRKVLTRQEVPDDWVISIVDANNLRVARSRAHDENLGGRLSDSAQQIVDTGGDGEGFGISVTLEGERSYTPYSRLSNGWNAVLGFPTSLADAAAFRALSVYGGGVLLSIAIAVLGSLWIARTITQPMAHLRRAAEAVGQRETPAPVDTSIQEIHAVAAALNAAADDLRRSEREREQLLHNERMARAAAETADRAKDEFMAVLSHELRTPLNAVYGWANMLADGRIHDPAMAERARRAIVRNADVQIQLIDELLDLSRIASGKLRLEIRRLDVRHVVQEAIDAVRPGAEEKGITIEAGPHEDPLYVEGDAGRLRQIVWNLLSNAVKFTPGGGNIQVRVHGENGEARITVRDTGEGIAPEILPYVFDRFRQGDSSSTRTHGGLGLGLALVRHLVELHGGRVTAESGGRGQGATFTVVLPVTAPDAFAAGTAPTMPLSVESETTVRLDRVRAVVVDDDEDGLDLTQAILTRAGASVRTAATATVALELVREWRPDILVSDIEMPGEDGYSLLRRVRALPPDDGGQTPAIALTAYGRPEDRERCLAAGFAMHVPKPVDPGELTAIVASVTGAAQQPDRPS